MENDKKFYTLKGYQLMEDVELTPAMEDYLEMIYRITQTNNCVKIRDLSHNLNVRPSSSSKMVQQLSGLGYIKSEKYGDIAMTEKGMAVGNYLLYRHNVIHSFLCLLNNSQDQLEETEKIEHFFSQLTVHNLDILVQHLINQKSTQDEGFT